MVVKLIIKYLFLRGGDGENRQPEADPPLAETRSFFLSIKIGNNNRPVEMMGIEPMSKAIHLKQSTSLVSLF